VIGQALSELLSYPAAVSFKLAYLGRAVEDDDRIGSYEDPVLTRPVASWQLGNLDGQWRSGPHATSELVMVASGVNWQEIAMEKFAVPA